MRHMMKMFGIMVVTFCMGSVLLATQSVHAYTYYDRLTKDDQTIVQTTDITDPMRQGAYNPGKQIDGLYNQGEITSFQQAK